MAAPRARVLGKKIGEACASPIPCFGLSIHACCAALVCERARFSLVSMCWPCQPPSLVLILPALGGGGGITYPPPTPSPIERSFRAVFSWVANVCIGSEAEVANYHPLRPLLGAKRTFYQRSINCIPAALCRAALMLPSAGLSGPGTGDDQCDRHRAAGRDAFRSLK